MYALGPLVRKSVDVKRINWLVSGSVYLITGGDIVILQACCHYM
jgi:hypothetical protein